MAFQALQEKAREQHKVEMKKLIQDTERTRLLAGRSIGLRWWVPFGTNAALGGS